MTWPRRQIEMTTRDWEISDLRVGDLVFGQKDAGPLAWLCDHADEPWRHVGSLIEDGGELKVIEVLGNAFRLRELSSFFDPARYVQWGAARLRIHPNCIAEAHDWMRAHLHGEEAADQVYAWDDLILAGIIAASHRGIVASHPERVRAAISAAGQFCKDNLEYRGQISLTCSSFIQLAYEHAGGSCAIEHRRWRSGLGWPQHRPSVDELFEMSAEQPGSFDNVSLLELHVAAQQVSRGTATTRAKPAHLGEAFKVFVAAVAGYALGQAPPGGLGVDSRWVTPGDLWRSPSVSERAYISPH